jgi:basic amino acid/polyamine antiporter, APA family
MASAPTGSSRLLLRQIGLYAAVCITVGNIIGSGIFRSPHIVAGHLHGLPLVLLAWVIGGVLSLCGSLVLAELAVASPETGGLYVFIRRGFGNAWGFVFGWANLWVIKPTLVASITSVFALYFCEALHLAAGLQIWVGMSAILLLTFINWLGVREGAGTQTLFTTLKVIGILALCLAAFGLPHAGPAGGVGAIAPAGGAPGLAVPADSATIAAAAAAAAATSSAAARPLWLALVVAMIPILFAYDGWTDSTYVAGEIKNPRRALPIAILGGTALVIVVYVITNLAYYRVLTPAEVAAIPAVGSETIGRILGTWGQRALAVLVAISTFGTTNGSILTGPRVTLAMADDGLLWKPLAHVDPKRRTPDRALWVQAVLGCLWLAASKGFEDVSGWFVTTSWLFYAVTTAALFVQRAAEKRSGKLVSDYRTPLFPLTAIVFILVTVVLIGSDLHDAGWRAAAGVLIAATGFPVYYFWRGRRRA